MSCCGNTEKRKTVTLVQSRKNLLYDISNYAFVEGDIIGGTAAHAAHQVKDIAEDGNIDRVTRVLNLAHAETVEMLYPYTKEMLSEEGAEYSDAMSEPAEYRVRMSVPEGFSATTVRLLQELVHEYMVCRALQDWLGMTYPDSAPVWAGKVDYFLGKIRASLVSRMVHIRRKMKPF